MYMSLCICSIICYIIIGHIVIYSMGYIAIINVNKDPLVLHKQYQGHTCKRLLNPPC